MGRDGSRERVVLLPKWPPWLRISTRWIMPSTCTQEPIFTTNDPSGTESSWQELSPSWATPHSHFTESSWLFWDTGVTFFGDVASYRAMEAQRPLMTCPGSHSSCRATKGGTVQINPRGSPSWGVTGGWGMGLLPPYHYRVERVHTNILRPRPCSLLLNHGTCFLTLSFTN